MNTYKKDNPSDFHKICLLSIIVIVPFWMGYLIGHNYPSKEIIEEKANEKAKSIFLDAVSYSISTGMLQINHAKVNEIKSSFISTNTTEEVEQQRLEAVETNETDKYNDSNIIMLSNNMVVVEEG